MEQVVYVKGMTCSACERHVEKALQEIKGVESIKVKWRKSLAVMQVKSPISKAKVKNALEGADYAIGSAPAGFFSGWVNDDRNVWKDFGKGILITLAVMAILKMFGALDLITALDPSTSGSVVNINTILVVLTIGLVASVSSCMALVGGIVLGVTSALVKVQPSASKAQFLLPQVAFNAGRVIGFGLLGALLGAIGSIFVLSNVVLTILTVLVGLVMLVLGIRLTEISPRVAKMQFVLPSGVAKFFAREEAKEVDSEGRLHPAKPFFLGVLTFFLPCGFTQAVQVFALATGSPVWSGVIMSTFAIGTTPGLLGVGMLGSFAKNLQTKLLLRVVGVVVIAFALINVNGAISQYVPITANIASAVSQFFEGFGSDNADTSKLTENVTLTEDGKSQTAVVTVTNGYNPKTTVLQADTPTKLTFKKGGISCAGSINLSSLGVDEIVRVFDSDQTVDVKLKPGTYNYSCSMGMYSGRFIAVEHEQKGIIPSEKKGK
ncbi:MAG: sulfite exporter TauE/SafE family protein [Candidatus Ancillula sp.]|nr:sulfite exporter TauE/SafE family protein [Candidatus Ancillula sp.]